jgi:hypothetical protein
MLRCEACDTGVYCGFCVASPMTGFFVSVRSKTTSRRRKSTSPAPEGERCASGATKFPEVSGRFPGRTFPCTGGRTLRQRAPQRILRQRDGASRGKTRRCVALADCRMADRFPAARYTRSIPRATDERRTTHGTDGAAAVRGMAPDCLPPATWAHALRRVSSLAYPPFVAGLPRWECSPRMIPANPDCLGDMCTHSVSVFASSHFRYGISNVVDSTASDSESPAGPKPSKPLS